MKNTVRLSATLAVMTTITVSSFSAEQRAVVTGQETTNTNSFDAYIQRLSQLDKEDAKGKNTFQSDRSAELQKIHSPSATANKVTFPLSSKSTELLLALKKPDNTSQESPPFFSGNTRLCQQLIEEQVVPIWTGENWIDSRPLVFNGFTLPDETQRQLASLNYWEQNFGIHFDPERKKIPFSGRNIGKINGLRLTIMNAGFLLKYDKTFGVWRITGTNAPAARPQ